MGVESTRVGFAVLPVVLFTLLAPSQVVAEEPFDRGQALYENHCMSCHESWAHSRAGRHVRTISELRARTAAWSVHSHLDWSAEEIDDVTDYLNRTFYQLQQTP
jgi:mono/diheme cytochrome c family protein